MACPLCGDICRCSSGAKSAASPRWRPDGEASVGVPTHHAELETPEAEAPSLSPAEESSIPADVGLAPEDSPAWRQEVAARLNRYQARRKPRPPRYPSLRLRFEQEDLSAPPSSSSVEAPVFPQRIGTASHQALALDSFAESATHAVEILTSAPLPQVQTSQETAALRQPRAPTTAPTTAPATAKIIEFPRSW